MLTDIIDQVREDLSWLTRNGLPHQPLSVIVHRLPHVGADTAPELLIAPWPAYDPTAALKDERVRDVVIDHVVERLAEPLGQFAQEQLNALLSVMDSAHREVMQAIRSPQPSAVAQENPRPKRSKRKRLHETAVPSAPAEPPPPVGQLF